MEYQTKTYTDVEKTPDYYGEHSINSFAEKIKREVSEQRDSTIMIGKNFQKEDVFVKVHQHEQKQAISHSLLTEGWEGCIKEVREETFTARLYKTSPQLGEVIEGEFEINDVPEYDRNLIREGVIFYWNIGKETKKSGTIINGANLIFRRMPAWKKFDINGPSTATEEFTRVFKQAH